MNTKLQQHLRRCKQRIERRLDKTKFEDSSPVFSGANIHYEVSSRTCAIACGGIGMIHEMVSRLGLAEEINRSLQVLKIYLPYAESDHALNIAYNLLAGGTCLDHRELRGNDEVYLDALGVQRIPDPTTAGDFVAVSPPGIYSSRWKLQPSGCGCGRNSEPVSRSCGDRCRWHDGRDDGRVQRGDRHQPQGSVGLPPLGGVAGQYGRAALCVQPQREPSQPRRGGRVSGPGGRALSSCGVSADHAARRHRFHPDGDVDCWDEDGIRFIFGIDAMPNLYDRVEESPVKRLEKARSSLALRGEYRAAQPPRERQAAGRGGT